MAMKTKAKGVKVPFKKKPGKPVQPKMKGKGKAKKAFPSKEKGEMNEDSDKD